MDTLIWRKASRSGSNGGCVEVANADGKTFVRDSKCPERGHVTVTRETWSRFVTAIKAGGFEDA